MSEIRIIRKFQTASDPVTRVQQTNYDTNEIN